MYEAFIRPKLSKRVYLGLRFGAPIPFEYITWKIAFETGWTLEYIEALPMSRYVEYIEIKDGIAKSRQ